MANTPRTPCVDAGSRPISRSPDGPTARTEMMGFGHGRKTEALSSKASKADVISFGGIAGERVTGLRSSDRLRAQPHADATQMERAMMVAQRHNDLLNQGTNLNKNITLLSFTEDEIVQKASRIWVSLGDDDISKRAAAKLILDSEVQRSFVMLKNNDSLLILREMTGTMI
jgi:hypothetical protein